MRAWSAVPRFGEATPDPRFGRSKGTVRGRIRAARFAALGGGFAFILLGLGAAVDLARVGEVGPVAVSARNLALFLALPLIGVSIAFGVVHAVIAKRAPGPVRTVYGRLAAAFATLAVVTTLSSLVLVFPEIGVPLRDWSLASLLASVAGREVGSVAGAVATLAIPVMVGWYVHAVALAVDGAGLAPSRVPFIRALTARAASDVITPAKPHEYAIGFARVSLLGFAVPSLAIWSLAGTLIGNGRARARGEVRDELHCAIDLDELGEGLAHARLNSRAWEHSLVVGVPPGSPTEVRVEAAESRLKRLMHDIARIGVTASPLEEEGVEPVEVTRRLLDLPPVAQGHILVLSGKPSAVRRLRRIIETEVLFRGIFAWSDEGVRYERRLNRLAKETRDARTVEERGFILEEANRLERILNGRGFLEEEWNVLAGWKTARVRAAVQEIMLTEPVGLKSPDRILARGPSLKPDLGKIVESPGLAKVKEYHYVPYWLIPVATGLGERDILVNAITRRVDLEESALLLEAVSAQGTTYFVEGARKAAFADAPPASGPLFGEVRQAIRLGLGYRGLIEVADELIDTVYVPFARVLGEDRLVNAITGEDAPAILKALKEEEVGNYAPPA